MIELFWTFLHVIFLLFFLKQYIYLASLNLSWSMWNLPCVTRGLVGCTRTLVVAYRLQSTWVEVLGLSCPALCGILVLWPEIEHMSLALQGRFLTTGPPGKSLMCLFLFIQSLVIRGILLSVPQMAYQLQFRISGINWCNSFCLFLA